MDSRDKFDTRTETTEPESDDEKILPVPVEDGKSDTSASDADRIDVEAVDLTAVKHPEDQPHAGMPGDGAGRKDVIEGKSGVYPFTDAPPDLDAPIRTGAEFGQGDRGPEGYYDAGTSEGSPAATAQELLEDEDAG
jgi:hypothetical protein